MTDVHVVELVIAMEVAYCTDMIKKGHPTQHFHFFTVHEV